MKIAALTSAAACLLAAAPAARADEPQWERREFECKRPDTCEAAECCQYGFAIYTREKPGHSVKEVRAVGEVDATPEVVFDAVTDYEHQKENLPYVKDCKVFKRTQDEVLFWAVADFPMVAARDWVLRSRLERNLPGGVFRASWVPAPEVTEAPVPADGVVRIKTNIGSWTMEPLEGGKRTRATYALFTDPGGSIPSFIANKANTTALPDLFAAIRKRVEPKGKPKPKENVANQ